ncbi:C1 family peptidase [Tenacibaculum piscium]|uniref:Aminopeptidase n=1 Tax=Tenacibaculum piscium TaxID=1458515 RepID=A0A2H1YEJ7_9FLAO|nr:C1 family peptidase [Tenacibaculum piscium]MBE7628393.1 aminopeptidase [Tenacibaculum piscium]MBE7669550.1 aminopeptidase [Tenacibaculum piscium]MBE7686302.1 aminopeptidase [Tenacibaculum piscium]MBE7689494.1 aminopeptidase [Tenacibaculum piscium]SOS73932.1 Aminopeptidase [Tenacibaculum piscium]
MKNLLIGAIFAFLSIGSITAQKYKFKTVKDIESSHVKSQGNTGTCWSFSTSSFLESEIIRLTGKNIDLSEMYTVRNTYSEKAENYVYRQGKAQFSQGGLAHDVLNSVANYGLVPEQIFSGLDAGKDIHNHAELIAVLKSMLDTYIKNPAKQLSPKWKQATQRVLDVYLGENKNEFSFEGKKYTPKSFAEFTKINPSEYLTITSFEHQKMYDKFILNIPDNFSNGSFYNVSLDELTELTQRAVEKGYTLALDCDVSEKTFSAENGVAFIPASSSESEKGLTEIVKEKTITPSFRQAEFENFNTTDDHLMHIVGLVKDQKGNKYFKVKNSWGAKKGNNGYVYMSVPYFKLKTISVLVHKDAVTNSLKKKLNIKN